MHFQYDYYGRIEYINYRDETCNFDPEENRAIEEEMKKHNVIFIYGGCFAIHVTFRTKEKDGTDNPLFTLLMEDDEQLFISRNPSFDYAWSTNLVEIVEAANKFVEEKRNEKVDSVRTV